MDYHLVSAPVDFSRQEEQQSAQIGEVAYSARMPFAW